MIGASIKRCAAISIPRSASAGVCDWSEVRMPCIRRNRDSRYGIGHSIQGINSTASIPIYRMRSVPVCCGSNVRPPYRDPYFICRNQITHGSERTTTQAAAMASGFPRSRWNHPQCETNAAPQIPV